MTSKSSSIPAVFFEQVAKFQSRPMVFSKRDRHWRPLTWAQMGERALHAAAGLQTLGIKRGERVAILAGSGVEWVLADLSILAAGAVCAAIYESMPADDVEYILRDADARAVFVGTQAHLDTVVGLKARLPDLQTIICLDRSLTAPDVEGLTVISLLALEGKGLEPGPIEAVRQTVDDLNADDLATFIYTSGTTGEPKGVMLTHGNLVSNCVATARALPVRSDDVLLSYLPLAHAFERMAGYYMALLFGGATVYFSEGLGRLVHNLQDVRPTLITGVPRVYEKIYAQFMARRDRANLFERRVVDWALGVGRKVSALRQRGKSPGPVLLAQYRLACDRVFERLTERLGGRLRFMVSGGAPLAREVAEFFHAAGLLIIEGYGLSESGPVLTVNRPENYRFGSVGRPLDTTRIRIAGDGEILAKGPNIMRGYHRLPEESARVLADGWLHTGDLGRIDDDGFLYITGRKKDLFKTAGGKYVAPQKLERRLVASPYVEHACVIGDRRPYCVALIVPNLAAVAAATKSKVPRDATSTRALLDATQTRQLMEREITRINTGLARHETLKSFKLLSTPFTQENGLLTPSLKVRRSAVELALASDIDGLYASGPRKRQRWR